MLCVSRSMCLHVQLLSCLQSSLLLSVANVLRHDAFDIENTVTSVPASPLRHANVSLDAVRIANGPCACLNNPSTYSRRH